MEDTEAFATFNAFASEEFHKQVPLLCEELISEHIRLNMNDTFSLMRIQGLRDPIRQEAIAKAIALTRMGFAEQEGRIPAILLPWVEAHRTNGAMTLIQGSALCILDKDIHSPIGKIAYETVQRFLPIAEYLCRYGISGEL